MRKQKVADLLGILVSEVHFVRYFQHLLMQVGCGLGLNPQTLFFDVLSSFTSIVASTYPVCFYTKSFHFNFFPSSLLLGLLPLLFTRQRPTSL